jgi:hypothetical protein
MLSPPNVVLSSLEDDGNDLAKSLRKQKATSGKFRQTETTTVPGTVSFRIGKQIG